MKVVIKAEFGKTTVTDGFFIKQESLDEVGNVISESIAMTPDLKNDINALVQSKELQIETLKEEVWTLLRAIVRNQ